MSTFFAACTKDANVDEIEKKLPVMSLSSFGISPDLTGPFANSNTISFVFGATASNTEVGAFDYAIYDAAVRVDSVHYEKWSGKGVTGISVSSVPSTYPNTKVYQGTITYKLDATKYLSGKKYTVKAYMRPAGNTAGYTPYQITVSNLITIK